jgi:hypothetical protein
MGWLPGDIFFSSGLQCVLIGLEPNFLIFLRFVLGFGNKDIINKLRTRTKYKSNKRNDNSMVTGVVTSGASEGWH